MFFKTYGRWLMANHPPPERELGVRIPPPVHYLKKRGKMFLWEKVFLMSQF